MRINDLTERTIAAAIEVHRAPGPGLLVLINFNVRLLKNGVRRRVHKLPEHSLRPLRSLR